MEDFYQKLLESSIRFISFRPRSEKEIRFYLGKKFQKHKISDAPLLDRIITRLRELDYVNDRKFAAWWVEQRQIHKPKGMRLIAQELKAKGIDRELVSVMMQSDNFPSGREQNYQDTQEGLARKALEKKLSLWDKLPKLEQKKKIYGFLGRRGFDGEVIGRVIDEVVARKVQS
ncbi:RecX family transcriptional regulator [Candidatus Gottesmanbacteria bacterium]|nr:RecX family transcriptional regulator [Candidatus Gottesmanbacteria bacterium]